MSIMNELDNICFAFFIFPSPIFIAINIEPPSPISVPKDVRSVTIGPHIPTPARASAPSPGIFPIYILSIML